jgi:hypothetical protein
MLNKEGYTQWTRTHAYTEKYVIVIAYARQQWFRERDAVFRYSYIVGFVIFCSYNIHVLRQVRAKM